MRKRTEARSKEKEPTNNVKRQAQEQEKGEVNVNHTHKRYLSLASTTLIGFPSRRISEASCARHIRSGGRNPLFGIADKWR